MIKLNPEHLYKIILVEISKFFIFQLKIIENKTRYHYKNLEKLLKYFGIKYLVLAEHYVENEICHVLWNG